MTKIVIISDTHNKHSGVIIPKCDLLIHCGDYSLHGSLVELSQFNTWLGTLPAEKILACAGNHDFIVEEIPSLAKKTLTNATLLIDEAIEVNGIKIYVSPWTPEYGRWAFMLKDKELKAKWDQIPNDTDILVTHGLPYWTLDKTERGIYAGSKTLAKRVAEIKPKICCGGHIHENYGETTISGVHYINASICNREYLPINKPIEVEL